MLDYLNSSLWNKPMELAEAEISILSGRPVALPAQHHLPVVLYGHTQHLPSARVTGLPQSQPWDSPADRQHWQMESLTSTHLWVYICVNRNISNKNDRLAMLMFSFSLPFQLANETTLLIVLLLPSVLALSIYFVLCWRTQTSSLYLGNAVILIWGGRRGGFRCCPATEECQLTISWWLCSFLPLPLCCLWCGVISLPPVLSFGAS